MSSKSSFLHAKFIEKNKKKFKNTIDILRDM